MARSAATGTAVTAGPADAVADAAAVTAGAAAVAGAAVEGAGFRRRPSPGRGAGAWVADVLTRGVRGPLGLGLEDEPLDRVGDREVQGQRRRTQTGQRASCYLLDPGIDAAERVRRYMNWRLEGLSGEMNLDAGLDGSDAAAYAIQAAARADAIARGASQHGFEFHARKGYRAATTTGTSSQSPSVTSREC